MGLCLEWALRCDDRNCVQKFTEEMAKFSDKDKNLFHKVYSPDHIMVCTGDDGVCLDFNFEPWKKALNQSYLMKKSRFKILGFGYPVFNGTGPFGHTYPDKMMKILDKHFGISVQSLEGKPVLGEKGYQTGDWVKTQYAGIEHHIKACEILDKARRISDKTIVGDDGGYCGEGDKHNLGELMDNFEEYTKINIRISGQLKKAGWNNEQVMGPGKDDVERIKDAGGS